jgi:hypothetical protein
MPEIIVGGGPLDGQQAATELYNFSRPCPIGECHAFFSHSWHDDSRLQWDALNAWCVEFEHARECTPRLWLDRVCIDQTNIKADLQCLPIFLAGCDMLLVISGATYTFRLWCCVVMVQQDESRVAPVVITIGANSDELALVRKGFTQFDAAACECFDPEDKKRIFTVIERFPGGAHDFNSYVKVTATALCRDVRRLDASKCSLSISPTQAEFAASACVAEVIEQGLEDVAMSLDRAPSASCPSVCAATAPDVIGKTSAAFRAASTTETWKTSTRADQQVVVNIENDADAGVHSESIAIASVVASRSSLDRDDLLAIDREADVDGANSKHKKKRRPKVEERSPKRRSTSAQTRRHGQSKRL